MQHTSTQGSLLDLVRSLKLETKEFLHKEIQLLKTELSEKLKHLGKNGAMVGAGIFLGIMGFYVVLLGFAFLIALGLYSAGMGMLGAAAGGLFIMGLLVSLTGALLAHKGWKEVSESSLSPEKTIETLQDSNAPAAAAAMSAPTPPGSQLHTQKTGIPSGSDKAQAEALRSRQEVEETIDELGERLSPRYMKAQVASKIREHPASSSAIAAILGFLGTWVLRRRHAH
jgi:hypothetical protein